MDILSVVCRPPQSTRRQSSLMALADWLSFPAIRLRQIRHNLFAARQSNMSLTAPAALGFISRSAESSKLCDAEFSNFCLSNKFSNLFPSALLATCLFLGLSSKEANAQDNSGAVHGKVVDEAGAGLPGVTVQLKGTSNGASTDENGEYQVEVSGDNPTLVFTSVGYSPQEIVVGSLQEINVSLLQDSKQLEEIVVVGYGSKRKESLTGAISTVNSEDIEHVHGGSTVSSGLAGKIQGVTFRMPDGRPGA